MTRDARGPWSVAWRAPVGNAYREINGALSRQMVVLALSAAATGVGIGLLGLRPESFLLLAISVVLLFPLGVRLVSRRFDPFEPIVTFAVAYGVMFAVRTSSLWLSGNLVSVRPSRTYDISSTFTEMLVLAAVGAIGFVGGYSIPWGRQFAGRLRPLAPELDSRRVLLASAVLVVIAILALVPIAQSADTSFVDLLFAGRSFELSRAIRGPSTYFWHGSFLLVPAALLLMVAWHQRRDPTALLGAMIVSLLVLLRTVPVGSRILLLPFLGGFFIYYFIARQRRPGRLMFVAVVGVALLLSAFLLDVRSPMGTPRDIVSIVEQRLSQPSSLIEPILSGEDAAMPSNLAAALYVIPEEIPHTLGGSVLADLVVRPIPRLLWEGKPLPPRETVMNALWPFEYAAGSVNSEFSVLLYFYMDFGVPGVAGGMLVMGVLWRSLYEYFLRHKGNRAVQLVFAATLPMLVLALRDSPTDTFVRATFIVIPIIVAFRVSARPNLATARTLTGPRASTSS